MGMWSSKFGLPIQELQLEEGSRPFCSIMRSVYVFGRKMFVLVVVVELMHIESLMSMQRCERSEVVAYMDRCLELLCRKQ